MMSIIASPFKKTGLLYPDNFVMLKNDRLFHKCVFCLQEFAFVKATIESKINPVCLYIPFSGVKFPAEAVMKPHNHTRGFVQHSLSEI